MPQSPQLAVRVMMASSGPNEDILGLGSFRQLLLDNLRIEDRDPARTEELVRIHSEAVAPLESAIVSPALTQDERKTAILDLAKSLDLLEEAACGPLLAGSRCTLADASLFPSMSLFSQTLVPHFGWEPWTDEALFYRRPRLHAWYELMKYEDAARQVEEAVASRLEEVVTDWSELAVDVPTSRVRKFPAHTA